MEAVGGAIEGPFDDRTQDEAADGRNRTADTSETTDAAGATPPEDPDDLEQRSLRANADGELDEIQRTTDDANHRCLKASDLDAARRELNEEGVARRADGEPFDHVDRVIRGQKWLMRSISRIRAMMTRVSVNTPQYARMERVLDDLSDRLDYPWNFVPKGTVPPSGPGPSAADAARVAIASGATSRGRASTPFERPPPPAEGVWRRPPATGDDRSPGR